MTVLCFSKEKKDTKYGVKRDWCGEWKNYSKETFISQNSLKKLKKLAADNIFHDKIKIQQI